jgi:hypothetical protein
MFVFLTPCLFYKQSFLPFEDGYIIRVVIHIKNYMTAICLLVVQSYVCISLLIISTIHAHFAGHLCKSDIQPWTLQHQVHFQLYLDTQPQLEGPNMPQLFATIQHFIV